MEDRHMSDSDSTKPVANGMPVHPFHQTFPAELVRSFIGLPVIRVWWGAGLGDPLRQPVFGIKTRNGTTMSLHALFANPE
jgi:hypothetical protein